MHLITRRTQGGPESMAFYAAGTKPLLDSSDNSTNRLSYADDGLAWGKLLSVYHWWKDFNISAPPFGVFPRADKTWALVKPEHLDRAKELFPDIKITAEFQHND